MKIGLKNTKMQNWVKQIIKSNNPKTTFEECNGVTLIKENKEEDE